MKTNIYKIDESVFGGFRGIKRLCDACANLQNKPIQKVQVSEKEADCEICFSK